MKPTPHSSEHRLVRRSLGEGGTPNTEHSTPSSGLVRRSLGEGGFTLMEVAIAVAVVLIGVLALFALITAGLDASAKSVADTQAAFFADNVFNGLAAASQSAAEKGTAADGKVQWRAFWQDFYNRQTNGYISIAAPATWTTPITTDIPKYLQIFRTPTTGLPASQVRTIKYEMLSQRAPGVKGIVNYALKYKLWVTFLPGIDPTDIQVTPGHFLTTPENTRVMVTLTIWDGEFNPCVTDTGELVYYSEFDNPGDL